MPPLPDLLDVPSLIAYVRGLFPPIKVTYFIIAVFIFTATFKHRAKYLVKVGWVIVVVVSGLWLLPPIDSSWAVAALLAAVTTAMNAVSPARSK